MSSRPRQHPGASGLVAMIAGMLVASSCFAMLYALLSLGCSLQWQSRSVAGIDLVTLTLVVVWGVHLAALLWVILATLRRRPDAATDRAPAFLRSVALILHLAALGSTIWFGFPLLVLAPCA